LTPRCCSAVLARLDADSVAIGGETSTDAGVASWPAASVERLGRGMLAVRVACQLQPCSSAPVTPPVTCRAVGALVRYGDDALDAMVQIVSELGDDLVNRRPNLPGATSPSQSSPQPPAQLGKALRCWWLQPNSPVGMAVMNADHTSWALRTCPVTVRANGHAECNIWPALTYKAIRARVCRARAAG
jgi:hypothetical protein